MNSPNPNQMVERVVTGGKTFWGKDAAGNRKGFAPGETVKVKLRTANAFKHYLKDPKVAAAEAKVAAAEAATETAEEVEVAEEVAAKPNAPKVTTGQNK